MNRSANIFAPPRRTLKPQRGIAKLAKPREKVFTLEYFVCFFSFTMLLYSSAAGTWAIVGFLAPWSLIVMKRFLSLPQVLRKSWPLLLLPFWAIASIAWSIEPAWTLRASLEFAGTVAVGILAAYCVNPKELIASLLSTYLVIAFMCIARSDTLSAIMAHDSIQGIFGSKNAFSAVICSLLLLSIAILVDKHQSKFFRILSIGGIFISPILLAAGRSVDAILAACFAVIIFLAVRLLARLDHKIRLIAVIFIVLIALFLVLVLSFAEFSPGFLLNAVGKDATLTGRTYLWHRAADLIAHKPLLGVGYNAFWRIDNMDARQLWYDSKVPIGSGFNFHNEYIDHWVDIGFVGFALVVGYLLTVSKRIVKTILGSMNAEQYCAFLLFAVFIIRSPVETGIFGAFNINMVLFCMMWKFFQFPKPQPAKPFGLPVRNKTFIASKVKAAS